MNVTSVQVLACEVVRFGGTCARVKAGTISTWFCVGCGLALASIAMGKLALDQLDQRDPLAATEVARSTDETLMFASMLTVSPVPAPPPSSSRASSSARAGKVVVQRPSHPLEGTAPPPHEESVSPPPTPLQASGASPTVSSSKVWSIDEPRLPANANMTWGFDPDEPRLPEGDVSLAQGVHGVHGTFGMIARATWDPNNARLPSEPTKPREWDPDDARLPL